MGGIWLLGRLQGTTTIMNVKPTYYYSSISDVKKEICASLLIMSLVIQRWH